MLKTYLQKLSDVGIKIKSLTCDGPSSHFSMLKSLGAVLDPSNLRPSFPHPSDTDVRVSVILDACHMLKLVRNTFADLKVLRTADGTEIKWAYLEELHALQEKEGLRLGNKLRSAHMQWKKQKMKVNLAAQSLSSSVADALVCCREQLNLPAFSGSEGTVNFIVLFDRLFDTLNSRNPLAKGFKAPLSSANFSFVDTFLSHAEQYIMSLTDRTGTSILENRLFRISCLYQKRANVGRRSSHVCCSSNEVFAHIQVVPQDHLELFFGAVRSAGGFNNNPTAIQFAASYRRLLMRHRIEGGAGNCAAQDNTIILDHVEEHTMSIDIATARRYDLQPQSLLGNELEDIEVPHIGAFIGIQRGSYLLHCRICRPHGFETNCLSCLH